MRPCSQCGASLPEEAKFCLQCGAPVQPPEPVEEMLPQPVGPPPELDFIQPALAGGLFLGLLSSLPLIGTLNCVCCMWVLGGGSMATMLLFKQQPLRKLTYGDGAFAGVLSGLFGSIVATVVSIPVKLLSARFIESQQQQIDAFFQNMPELQGPLKDLLQRAMSPEISVATLAFTLLSNLIVYALFAMVGGILTVVYLEKKKKKAALQQPPQ